MVIKGKSVAGAFRLAAHLQRTDTNERMIVAEMRDVAAENLQGALREMEAVASANPNCKKPFYHASINTRADERLSEEQRTQAIDRLEKELGLGDQPRVVVIHEKEGREHCHIVWSRIDIEAMRVISDSHNYRKHELVARELEREFGHERVQGVHVERDGVERPERTPSHKEHQQAERTGVRPKEAKELLTGIWRATESGQAFQNGLEEKGWILARGDRRDFVVVDPRGGVHSLVRQIEGAKVADVRQRFVDVNPFGLYGVAEAREVQAKRAGERGRDLAARRARAARTRPRISTRPVSKSAEAVLGAAPKVAGVAGGALKSVGKALDGVASAFESLFGGAPAPKPVRDDDDRPLAAGPPPSEIEREAAVRRDQEEKAKLAAKYGLEFGPDLPLEIAPDREIELGRGGRERKRGE